MKNRHLTAERIPDEDRVVDDLVKSGRDLTAIQDTARGANSCIPEAVDEIVEKDFLRLHQ